MVEQFAEKVSSESGVPSAAEAVFDSAVFTARVELVPFPQPSREPSHSQSARMTGASTLSRAHGVTMDSGENASRHRQRHR